MKLSVSNIAWAADEADRAYALLRDGGATGLEIAPGLFLPDAASPASADTEMCERALDKARAYGLELSSMQSLLFGATGAALFGASGERAELARALTGTIALAGRLGIGNLVFGSPKQRVISEGMSGAVVQDIWLAAFRHFGDLAAEAGTLFSLEPNPERYGTNFMTSLAETVEVARHVDHPAVRVNLDLGALIITGEIDTIDSWLPEVLPLVGHVHVSAPDLVPPTTEPDAVRKFCSALATGGWNGWVSLEMRADAEALPKAIELCRSAIEDAK